MCKVQEMKIGEQTIRIADIKTKYIKNIVDAANDCDYIDKIIIFGSSTKSTCRKDSDIDMAVFGKEAKGKVYSSKKYREFLNRLGHFDNFSQTYDVLYFKTDKKYDDAIMQEIEKGETIYAR